MYRPTKKTIVFQRQLLFIILLASTQNVFAIPFGVYEPRSLAMGGTGVATANSINAIYYNPSLLAVLDKYKERSKKQAFSFPVIAGRASKSLEDLSDINDRNYDSSVSSAISTYNASPTITNASSALTVIQSLQNDLAAVSNQLVLADISASLAIGIPSKNAGGAFYYLVRGVGDGNINITASDSTLISDYQEALLFISSGGTQGSSHPELFSGGNLIDPIDSLTSTANARAVIITEMGVSFASTFNLFNQKVLLSMKPKTYKVKTFSYSSSITNNTINKQQVENDEWYLNIDLGATYNISKTWRLGLAIKDIVPKDFQTSDGNAIKIKPQIRMGVAYFNPSYTLTADLDLLENEGVFENNKKQYLLLGGEIPVSFLKLRAGYRYALRSEVADEDGVLSVGIGLNIKSFYLDFAYSENSEQIGAGLMLGFTF